MVSSCLDVVSRDLLVSIRARIRVKWFGRVGKPYCRFRKIPMSRGPNSRDPPEALASGVGEANRIHGNCSSGHSDAVVVLRLPESHLCGEQHTWRERFVSPSTWPHCKGTLRRTSRRSRRLST